MKYAVGKKLKMTQIFDDNGNVVPVTPVLIFDAVVSQVKAREGADKYNGLQVSFMEVKETKINQPRKGHLKDLGNFRHSSEFRTENKPYGANSKAHNPEVKKGDKLSVEQFVVGEKVAVSGVTIGKGFQGVVKRHGFKGSPASHGHKDQLRMPGSLASKRGDKVAKGKRMGGRTGGENKTVSNLKIVKVDNSGKTIFLKGAVPGAINGILKIVNTK